MINLCMECISKSIFAFLVVTVVLYLRNNEGFMMDFSEDKLTKVVFRDCCETLDWLP